MSPAILAILAALAKVLGPMLLDFLRQLFAKASKNVSDPTDTDAVFAESIRLTKGKPFRRALVRAIHPMAERLVRGKPTAADVAELTTLAAKAKGE